LAEYGPDAEHPRDLLRGAAELTLERLWPADGAAPFSLAPGASRPEMEALIREIKRLSPQNERQQSLKTDALRVMSDLAQARLQIYVHGASGLPLPFLVVTVLCLMILFAGYGLIAAHNPTMIIFILACTLSVAGAVFLIQELANPFQGLVRVSSVPLRVVIGQLGR
jgi:hypothetical protein